MGSSLCFKPKTKPKNTWNETQRCEKTILLTLKFLRLTEVEQMTQKVIQNRFFKKSPSFFSLISGVPDI